MKNIMRKRKGACGCRAECARGGGHVDAEQNVQEEGGPVDEEHNVQDDGGQMEDAFDPDIDDYIVDPDYDVWDDDDDLLTELRSTGQLDEESSVPVNGMNTMFNQHRAESDYIASDDNNTASDSDGQTGTRFNRFDEQAARANPSFTEGMLFDNRHQFKMACREWGIVNKNNPDYTNFHVTSAYLADSFLEEFRNNPDYTPEQFKGKIQRELKQNIPIQKARRARRMALDKLDGDEDGQYEKIYDYRREVLRTNPGSTVEFKEPRGKFQGMYVCFDAMKRAFRNGLREIVCLDGCWLKGKYGGQLLSATGIDPNDCMYPLAMAWVKVENIESWTWFMELLKADLHLGNSSVFMSDKQKGLINAVKELFPYSEYRFCWRHLWSNYRSTFHHQHLKPLIWNIGIASYKSKYVAAMKVLEDSHSEAYEWISARSRVHWSRYYFGT
ncbi:uncharacterized protein LOC126660596 [Mercurialis annua]|uniref:uncharacterized protein LOC126660596 n=1 Tax=Mercurialis annua TaxID=3986 RepID=UPI00215F48E9|nr:uncharacterized protein LOC126660596 [Mercurialis annua]